MKDPDYAAAYNRQQLRLKKYEFEKAGYGSDDEMAGNIYTPEGLGRERDWLPNYYDRKNPFKNSKQFLKSLRKRRTVENPGLFENFSGWPKEDIDMPNLHIYPETRKGSLLDTGYINKKKPNLERIGNEGVSRAYPNEKLGGRKTRKRRGKGKKRKTRRIVCRKRKLTRKKRRRRR